MQLYAELVKANGFFNKYLSLLEKISLERPNDINLADKVEIYNSIVLDTVSGNWGIDQFIQNVPRFNLQLFISKTSVPLNTYNEGVHLGSYFLHSLHGYENIEATFMKILKQLLILIPLILIMLTKFQENPVVTIF